MIKQISDMVINFTLTVYPPENKWGENYSLDQSGATLHLSSTYSINDLDGYHWIKENKLAFTVKINYTSKVMRLKFGSLEDAMAFKLRWL